MADKKTSPDLTVKPRDARIIKKLITESVDGAPIGKRMKIISGRLLGLPYIVHPLIGSANKPEIFVTRMDGFDCVTYIETVLALAHAKSVEEFPQILREIRYEDGQVDWRKRLHYTTDWSKYNIEHGILTDMTNGTGTVVRDKTLNSLSGYGARGASFRYYPKRMFYSVSKWLEDGDLIYFVSTRKGIDTFHVGMIFRDGDRILMRHAARSRGGVVEQELTDFIQANRMSGFIIARPV